MKKTLNVFFTIDKNYVVYFTVALTSLLENNKDLQLNIFLIHDLDDATILDEVVDFADKKYGVKLNILFIDSTLFDKYHITNHVTKATYFRLLIADIIPANVETGLFIDSDLVVTGSLANLAETEFADVSAPTSQEARKYLFAVSEIEGERRLNSKRITEMGYPTEGYFNAGVMLINLKNWRLSNTSENLIRIAEKHMHELVYWDQYVLNIYFANRWGSLDPTYNALHTIRELPKVPLIIHFAGPLKPWNYMCKHPYRELYFKYLKLTPYNSSKKYVDFSLGKLFGKHILETRDYINFYRSGEYKKVGR